MILAAGLIVLILLRSLIRFGLNDILVDLLLWSLYYEVQLVDKVVINVT